MYKVKQFFIKYKIMFFLILVVVIMLMLKNIFGGQRENMVESEIASNPISNLISPTIVNLPINKEKTYKGKTKEEILQMEPEIKYEFIAQLSREEVEGLDMMPNYDFSDLLPYKDQNFIVEKFDYENKKLTVKPLIEDKNQIREEVESWLFYSNGNNPKKIEIIWSE